MASRKDFTGRRLKRLLVLGPVEEGKPAKETSWYCKCDCGNHVVRNGDKISGNKLRSCGCLSLERPTSWKQQYNIYRRAAIKRNLEFSLTFEDFCRLTAQDCVYCGTSPREIHKSRKKWHVSNGIDRENNSIGYVLDNCVTCCRTCNFMKHTQTKEDFITQCKRIADLHSNTIARAA